MLAIALFISPAIAQEEEQFSRRADGVVTPLDWTGSFVAVYDCENSGNLGLNETAVGMGCGTDCDLTNNNTVTQNTTDFVTGSASCDFASASDQFLDCAAATCEETLVAGPSHTFGCWARPDGEPNDTEIMGNRFSGSAGGARMRSQGNEAIRSEMGDGTSNFTNVHDGGDFADATWTHAVQRLDADGAGEWVGFADAVEDGGPTAVTTDMAAGSGDFVLSSATGSADWNGELDECWVIADVLTNAEICRICSCGIDGTAGPCVCDGATYTDEGRNDSSDPGCSSCSLVGVACNAAAP